MINRRSTVRDVVGSYRKLDFARQFLGRFEENRESPLYTAGLSAEN